MANPADAKRDVTAAQLANRIAGNLANRWLGDPAAITRELKRLTGSRAGWIPALATSITQ
ncbi:hypothetical protein [Aporhodopirellula aestuarii]|uniref:Uncharacterized protein n=1 Tax=Aporhodopirellula aestuarii TaxID=2950107 RepID=A0ABT0U3J5_9BACT|nr:hypothetical protein [Aporhodopirellula aestuarii]MCM2371418.1 hypothetical protein [Aporhodopirellula aestuarii]